MKYLILLLIILWATPVSAAAPTLSSCSDFDRTVACDNFVTSIVYIKADGFLKNRVYRVIFWDGTGDNVSQQDLTGAALNANKTLQHVFVLPDAPGTWRCVAYTDGYRPACYNPSDPNIVAECVNEIVKNVFTVGFTVQPGAIPEIESVVAGIVVAGLCFGIYLRIRKIHLTK